MSDSNNAQILMAQPRGFCAGVDRAINSQRDFMSPEQLITTQDQHLLDLAMMCFPAYAIARLAL